MNYNIKLFISVISMVIWLLFSCEKEIPSEFEPKPVIEAYLFEGMPIKDIKISELTEFNKLNDQQKKYLSGLFVNVKIQNIVYALKESTNNPGHYSMPDSTFILQPAQILEFSCTYNSKDVSSQTVVPYKPVNVSISETTKYISPIQNIWDLDQLRDISIQITWSNTDHSYYYVTVKNLDSNHESIDPNGYIPDLDAFDIPPLITDFATIFFNKIKYYGNYRVIVSRVNPEYAALYQTQNQDSRTLSEPITNITNGYGIFTAFATDTVYFEVKKP